MNWEISYGYEGGPHNGPTNPHSVKDHLEAGWEPFAVGFGAFVTRESPNHLPELVALMPTAPLQDSNDGRFGTVPTVIANA